MKIMSDNAKTFNSAKNMIADALGSVEVKHHFSDVNVKWTNIQECEEYDRPITRLDHSVEAKVVQLSITYLDANRCAVGCIKQHHQGVNKRKAR